MANPFTLAPEFYEWQSLGITAVRQKKANLFKMRLQPGQSKPILLIADVHWDNPKCQRKLLRRDLDEAVKRGAGIMIFGDLFCAMQGSGDFRGTKSDVRPEHATVTYLDALVKTALKWFEPYKDHIIFVSPGNHETGVLKRKETDLIERFVTGLNQAGGNCIHGDYSGYNVFKLDDGEKKAIFRLAYHHGWGGGGPVTRGSIQDVRFQARTDADCYVFGHIHEKYMHLDPVQRFVDTDESDESEESVSNIINMRYTARVGTYKQEFTGNGFHVEGGRPPKPDGGWFMNLMLAPSKTNPNVIAQFEATLSTCELGYDFFMAADLYD